MTVASVLAAMGVVALLAKPPAVIEVLAAIFVVLGPTYAWIALRTRITLMPNAVRVATVRGVTDFAAGDAQVRVGRTPSGFIGSVPLLTLVRLSDDRKVSVPLVSFPRGVRATLPGLVRRTLRATDR